MASSRQPSGVDGPLLISTLLGDPHANLEKATSDMIHAFEPKAGKGGGQHKAARVAMMKQLSEAPTKILESQPLLDKQLDHTTAQVSTTLERLQQLQSMLNETKQRKAAKTEHPIQAQKRAFEKEIQEAKESFDQEMTLRHNDMIKQYVGTFVHAT
ncbi:hypothetical protein DFQ27_001472 [Actinomortierella ambigua]|uniref:Biogenesis of lysosome-related organelles complex 1 subunit 5 n=1 Tax=Actinomortierella ambigua TaxID=1343610 RepID=A0A9P6UCS1_9FUNG|nr:hypothetical protein DFQ27_001472 [Actinomortierella ambigua]